MRRHAFAFVLAAALTAAGCGGRAPDPSDVRPDSRILTREQMLERHFLTAMDAVQALKGNWLASRGRDSFTVPSQLWVYFDNVRLGNANTLRTISTRDVAYLRYFNGVEATARWGVGHSAGVILAASWPAGEPSETEPEAPVRPDTTDRNFRGGARPERPTWGTVTAQHAGPVGAGPILDRGVVLQKLMVDVRGLKPGYLGSPESPRSQDGRLAP